MVPSTGSSDAVTHHRSSLLRFAANGTPNPPSFTDSAAAFAACTPLSLRRTTATSLLPILQTRVLGCKGDRRVGDAGRVCFLPATDIRPAVSEPVAELGAATRVAGGACLRTFCSASTTALVRPPTVTKVIGSPSCVVTGVFPPAPPRCCWPLPQRR